jgi:hypothetical protein
VITTPLGGYFICGNVIVFFIWSARAIKDIIKIGVKIQTIAIWNPMTKSGRSVMVRKNAGFLTIT